MKKYCLALDLKDDEALIKEYEQYHKEVWPEILQSIKESGIEEMEIYRTGNRLFMIMKTDEGFNFEDKAKADAANAKVQEWETLMWKYQQAIPGSKPGEKWVLMEKIFDLTPTPLLEERELGE
jgi:L-rhamnose mutarotase